jgi:hypothetical protein
MQLAAALSLVVAMVAAQMQYLLFVSISLCHLARGQSNLA